MDRFNRPHEGFRAHLAAKGTPQDEIDLLCAQLDITLDQVAKAQALRDPEKEAKMALAWSRWYALPLELKQQAADARWPIPACALELWDGLSELQQANAIETAGPWWDEHEAQRIRERDGIDPDAGDAREPE